MERVTLLLFTPSDLNRAFLLLFSQAVAARPPFITLSHPWTWFCSLLLQDIASLGEASMFVYIIYWPLLSVFTCPKFLERQKYYHKCDMVSDLWNFMAQMEDECVNKRVACAVLSVGWPYTLRQAWLMPVVLVSWERSLALLQLKATAVISGIQG